MSVTIFGTPAAPTGSNPPKCRAAAATTPTPTGDPYRHTRRAPGPIALTVAEIRCLFTTLVARPSHAEAHRLRWSLWLRQHQASARRSHYNRRLVVGLPY